LYSLFLEKWLEHFPIDQFLVLRLEDYHQDPKAYMQRIFAFLGLDDATAAELPVNWDKILTNVHFNANKNVHKEAILEATETALRAFYAPYNRLLAKMLNNTNFEWESPVTLRSKQLLEEEQARLHPVDEADVHRPIDRRGKGIQRDPLPIPLHARNHDQEDTDAEEVDRGNDAMDRKRMAIEARRRHHGDRELPSKVMVEDQSIGSGHRSAHPHPPALEIRPQNFSLEGLVYGSSIGSLLRDLHAIDEEKLSKDPSLISAESAAKQLCFAAFALDTAALKYLLYDLGLPANLFQKDDSNRSPLQCLAMLGAMVEASPRSQVFAMLKGVDTYLTSMFAPSLPVQMHSVYTKAILSNLNESISHVTRWLIRGGVDVKHVDVAGNSFLHYAAHSGLLSLVTVALTESSLNQDEEWELVNLANHEGRTALHYAASAGHTVMLQFLVDHQGNLDKQDSNHVSAMDIAMTPGPISADDAMHYLKIQQRPVKQIANRSEMHRLRDRGGWDSARLAGFEDDYACDFDQYNADEITGEDIFFKYIARNAPILIRGLLDHWPANELYRKENFTAVYGNLSVEVSDIPYANKFGGAGKVTMTMGEYIINTDKHHVVGGEHPWYVFRGHPIPQASEGATSTVPYEKCPTPQVIYDAAKRFYPKPVASIESKDSREMFVNAQFALGGGGTGAPVHFHNTAWSALVYGAKKWVVYPPGHAVMSNMQIKEYFETDLQQIADQGAQSKSCVQLAGDVMIIPENYGHGVLNIEVSSPNLSREECD
jgi:ankyrin repeat protein